MLLKTNLAGSDGQNEEDIGRVDNQKEFSVFVICIKIRRNAFNFSFVLVVFTVRKDFEIYSKTLLVLISTVSCINIIPDMKSHCDLRRS